MANALTLQYIKKFTGYKNYRDITNLLPTDLAAGSQNFFIEDGVKLQTRGGMSYLGAEGTVGNTTDPYWTVAHRIHSHYDSFENNQGIIMPMRIWYSGTLAQGDVMDVWLPEYLAGVAQTTKKWYQTTANAPANPVISAHKWYFAEWFDPVNEDNRIVFTYGSETVSSFTGGFAPIISTTPTTITTSGTSWEEMGFINAPEGIATIVVNVSGIPTEIPLASGDFSTNTITVASTTGIVVNDIVFQVFNNDTIDNQATPTGFHADVCGTFGNQVYYEDWLQRNVLVSWAFNQQAFSSIAPVYQGTSGLNDAVFSGTYLGTQTDTIQVSIDSINPQSQTFTGTGLNDGYFNTSGYTGTGINNYRLIFVADYAFTFTGTPSIVPNPGDILQGSVSGAIGRVAFIDSGGQDPVLVLLTPQGFQVGDVITGTQGSYGTVATASSINWFQLFKNGSPITPTGYSPFIAYPFSSPVGPQTISFVDGLSITFQSTTGHTVGDYFTLYPGGPDTFTFSLNGVAQTTGNLVSLTPVALGSTGISVNWEQLTGHAVGDNWTITEYPTIIRGWRQVYYTGDGTGPGATSGSGRLPGEGFQFTLNANGYTLVPQENSMYLVDSAGTYYNVTVKYSENLQNQTFLVNNLKNDFSKKPLYPYAITNEPNYVSLVSTELTWDQLGQLKFLQLPQYRTLSDQVKIDFQNANWLNMDQLYFNRRQFFILPEDGSVFCFDDFMKYWQPPQTFGRRIASMCVIDGVMCAHSYERNETYQIYTDDLNDLGLFPIPVSMNLSYYDFNARFNKKTMSAVAFDGYMQGSPKISWTVNFGVGGCNGIQTGVIDPIFCIPTDTASLGKSQYGFHGLGNSNNPVIPHWTYGWTFFEQNYYLRNVVLACNSLEQNWSITAIGHDLKMNIVSNSDIFNP